MNDQVKMRITELLNQRFEGTPFYLVDVKKSSPTRMTVFIDHDVKLKIVDCAKVSRYLEEYLDAEQPLGEKYTLDVSSPGMFNQMKLARQYKKRIGSRFDLYLTSGAQHRAKLIKVEGEKLFFEEEKTKKNPEPQTVVLEIEDIKKTKLKFSFNKKQKIQ